MNGKIAITAGGGTVGADQMRRNYLKGRHDRLAREQDRGRGLNDGSINPSQYVLYCSLDNVPKEHIKAGLVAWGGKSNGCNFSNLEAFEVQNEDIVSANEWKRRFGIPEKSCRLNIYKSEKKRKLPDHFGKRGGYTETTEVQQVIENNTEMATGGYKSHPNLFCETSEEYVQGIPDREVLYTYSVVRPNTVPPLSFM